MASGTDKRLISNHYYGELYPHPKFMIFSEKDKFKAIMLRYDCFKIPLPQKNNKFGISFFRHGSDGGKWNEEGQTQIFLK